MKDKFKKSIFKCVLGVACLATAFGVCKGIAPTSASGDDGEVQGALGGGHGSPSESGRVTPQYDGSEFPWCTGIDRDGRDVRARLR